MVTMNTHKAPKKLIPALTTLETEAVNLNREYISEKVLAVIATAKEL